MTLYSTQSMSFSVYTAGILILLHVRAGDEALKHVHVRGAVVQTSKTRERSHRDKSPVTDFTPPRFPSGESVCVLP